MNYKQIKVGMKVKISPNIELTTEKLSSNPQMHRMAGDRKIYKVQHISSDNYHDTIVQVNNFVWMPQDLINAEEGYKQPVTVKGKKETFDPSEL